MAGASQSTSEGIDVKGLNFQNDKKPMHSLEKLSLEFKKESTEISTKNLSKIAERQDMEKFQAVFHGGRYALS